MSCNIEEALDLCVLCRQVHDRVSHEIGECVRAIHFGGREVADRHIDVGGTGLGMQLLDHRCRQLDAVKSYAAATQWKRETARADTKFEDGPFAGQTCEKFHCGLDDLRLEQ